MALFLFLCTYRQNGQYRSMCTTFLAFQTRVHLEQACSAHGKVFFFTEEQLNNIKLSSKVLHKIIIHWFIHVCEFCARLITLTACTAVCEHNRITTRYGWTSCSPGWLLIRCENLVNINSHVTQGADVVGYAHSTYQLVAALLEVSSLLISWK